MAYIRNYRENQEFLKTGEDPNAPIGTSGGAVGEGGATQASAGPSTPQATQQAEGGGETPPPRLQPLGTSLSLDEAGERASGLSERALDLGSSFRESVGPGIEFGDAHRQQLARALAEGQASPTWQSSLELLQGSYGGPQSLDAEAVAGIRHQAGEIQTLGEALARGRGLSSYLQGENPGLTFGQSRFEARKLADDSGFSREALGVAEAARGARAALAGEERAASDLVSEREAQAKAAAEGARGFLGERREGTLGGVDERVGREQAEQEELAKAWQALMQQDADLSEFIGRPGFEGITTKAQQDRIAAENLRKELEAKYQDIAEIPMPTLGITGRGHERLWFEYGGAPWQLTHALSGGFHGASEDQQRPDISPEEWKALAQRVYDRQLDYARGFASPTLLTGTGKAAEEVLPVGFTPETGDYYKYDPLFFGESIEGIPLPDPRQFASFDPGMDPTRELLMEEAEREELNRIAELLGESQRYMPSEEEYRDARVQVDREGLTKAERAALKKRDDALRETAQDWRTRRRRIKRDYGRSKSVIRKIDPFYKRHEGPYHGSG